MSVDGAASRRAFRRSLPSEDGVVRLGAAIGERIVHAERLGGGLATATAALRCESGRELVLKRFVPDDPPPSGAELEWERLSFAHVAGLPSPEPVAVDVAGEWFATAAIVMTRLPGAASFTGEPAWID